MARIRNCELVLAVWAALWAGRAAAQMPANADAAQGVSAQSPNAQSQLPVFDVVSIKPYGPDNLMIRIRTTPDGVSVSGMPMHMILREAFGLTNDRLLGEPGWVSANRYDVDAKVAPEDATRYMQLTGRQQWAMLLPALEDRCALKFHHETRDLTVYTLVVAKGGPKLQPSKPARAETNQKAGQNPRANSASAGASVSEKSFTISGHGQSTALIARWISLQLGSTVIDKTGLTDKYDYSLSFAPDESMKAGILPPGSGRGAPPPEAEGPSIFTAVQEQLGLKLEAQKEPVDVVVIDHMEPPTGN